MNSDSRRVRKTPRSSFDLNLLNNDPLPNVVLQEIRQILPFTEKKMNALGEEISRLQSLLEGLCVEHRRLESTVQSYRQAVAPHRNIPNELLTEIFLNCVADSNGIAIPLHRSDAPLNLLQACSRWRRVVQTTPELWKDVRITYDRNFNHVLCTAAARDIILRSTPSPISLRIEGWPTSARFCKEPFDDLILPVVNRLKSLYIEASPNSLNSFFQIPPGSVGLLQSLSIQFHGQPYLTPGSVTVFRSAHNLRKVDIRILLNIVTVVHPLVFDLPWAQLVNLHLPDVTVYNYEAYVMLSQCTRLVSCRLALEDDNPTYEERLLEQPPLDIPTLKSFTITDSEYCTPLLQKLQIPNLHTLVLYSEFNFLASDWKLCFLPFFTRSCSLRKLDTSVTIPSALIEIFLQKLPHLVHLWFRNGDVFPSHTVGLISEGQLLPKIQNLCCSAGDLNPFLDMLEDRHYVRGYLGRGSFKTIRAVRIHWAGTTEANLGEWQRAQELIGGDYTISFLGPHIYRFSTFEP